MIVKAVREGLGRLIIGIDLLTRPRKMRRSTEAQAAVNKAAQNLSLYQFYACPFCTKTRRAIHRLNLPITLRDAQKNSQHRQELLAEGGKIKVPCLKVEEAGESRWMYDSNEIIRYLDANFS